MRAKFIAAQEFFWFMKTCVFLWKSAGAGEHLHAYYVSEQRFKFDVPLFCVVVARKRAAFDLSDSIRTDYSCIEKEGTACS